MPCKFGLGPKILACKRATATEYTNNRAREIAMECQIVKRVEPIQQCVRQVKWHVEWEKVAGNKTCLVWEGNACVHTRASASACYICKQLLHSPRARQLWLLSAMAYHLTGTVTPQIIPTLSPTLLTSLENTCQRMAWHVHRACTRSTSGCIWEFSSTSGR